MKFISSGKFHVCAILEDNTAKCWGRNTVGQLGYEDTSHRGNSPSEMGTYLPEINLGPGLTTTLIISSTEDTTCGIMNTGIVKCWGDAARGLRFILLSIHLYILFSKQLILTTNSNNFIFSCYRKSWLWRYSG